MSERVSKSGSGSLLRGTAHPSAGIPRSENEYDSDFLQVGSKNSSGFNTPNTTPNGKKRTALSRVNNHNPAATAAASGGGNATVPSLPLRLSLMGSRQHSRAESEADSMASDLSVEELKLHFAYE